MGILPLTGWFTKFEGYVFNDLNRNGKQDAGEAGVPNFAPHPAQARELADGPRRDRGHHRPVRLLRHGERLPADAVARPRGLRRPLLHDRRHLPGRQPADTRRRCSAQGVDVSVLPIIGLSGRSTGASTSTTPPATNGVDPQNGGIVGSVSYDTTRNELDPQYAAAEDWQPGISGLTVELYAPVACGTTGARRATPRGDYELAPDGSYAKGKLLNTYVTETWERPDRTASPATSTATRSPIPDDQQVLPIGRAARTASKAR